jgi:flagellar transport protein fliP
MVANFDKNFVIPKQSAAQLPVGKHERKRQILHIVAVRSALVGFVLIMSPFAVDCFVSTVPGDHGDGGDSLSWMVAGYLIMITPIGLICVGFAGILLIIRALLR